MYSHPDIEEILMIFENSNCFDCGGSEPKWTSLNNGIFLCLKCARNHHKYDPQITNILSLQTHHFTEEELVFLMKGGNHKFKLFLAEYNITFDSPFELKYFSKAANYYRKCLENEVYKVTKEQFVPSLNIKPDLNVGIQIMEIKYNPEIKEESLFGKMGDTMKYVGKEINEMKIGDKIYNAGSTIYDYAKISGNYIVGKTKEAYNSEFVQNMTKKAVEGINSAYQTAKSYITK